MSSLALQSAGSFMSLTVWSLAPVFPDHTLLRTWHMAVWWSNLPTVQLFCHHPEYENFKLHARHGKNRFLTILSLVMADDRMFSQRMCESNLSVYMPTRKNKDLLPLKKYLIIIFGLEWPPRYCCRPATGQIRQIQLVLCYKTTRFGFWWTTKAFLLNQQRLSCFYVWLFQSYLGYKAIKGNQHWVNKDVCGHCL